MTTILVIEDEAIILENIMELLHMEGYEAIGAKNGSIGVELAAQYRPDLIICDVMMPELDGYQVLAELRKRDMASIPFIFLTARAERDAQRKGMEVGADDYITKPFTYEELLTAISVRLARHTALAQEQENRIENLRLHLAHMLPHELRTPLNAILGFSELLLTDPRISEMSDIVELIGQINIAGQRLVRLTENFLLYAQIQLLKSRGESPQGFTTTAKEIVETCALRKAQELHRDTDLHLDVADGPALRISSESLRKIAVELIDNAFKFSESSSAVHVSTKYTGNEYLLRVCNLGSGMRPEQIAEIGAFMQFERKLYEQQGSGLGLTLVKELTDLYGGGLQIQSVLFEQTTVTVIFGLAENPDYDLYARTNYAGVL